MAKRRALPREQWFLEIILKAIKAFLKAVRKGTGLNVSRHWCQRKQVAGLLSGAKHIVEVSVQERLGITRYLGSVVRVLLGRRGVCGVAMERLRARELVWRTGEMSGIVVAVAGLVMAVGEDGHVAVRVGGCDFGSGAHVVERLATGVESETGRVFLGAAHAFAARVAAAVTAMSLCIILVLQVLLVAALAFGVVRLGFACTATVLALLDGTTLGVDVVQFAISVVAAAHTVALDAGLARILLTIDERHAARSRPDVGVTLDGRPRFGEQVTQDPTVDQRG